MIFFSCEKSRISIRPGRRRRVIADRTIELLIIVGEEASTILFLPECFFFFFFNTRNNQYNNVSDRKKECVERVTVVRCPFSIALKFVSYIRFALQRKSRLIETEGKNLPF